MKTRILSAITSFFFLTSAAAFAQNVEITGHVGYQLNGGLDNLQTVLFERLEIENSTNYGASIGYLVSDGLGLEFQWNHTQADALAEPFGGGPDVRLFSMNENQYMGNVVWHFTPREEKVRPFAFIGLGATSLTPDRPNVDGTTKFSWAVGTGAKYNINDYFGLRGTLRYSPTYITSTAEGYWCDPFWGGCWTLADYHYLHSFDLSGGITFRF